MIKYRWVTLALCGLFGLPDLAQAFDLTEDGQWKFKGVLRLRFESDWNSHKADGSERIGRQRLRIATNAELLYQPLKVLSFGVRMGIGNNDTNSNGFMTILNFQKNPPAANNVYLDKWYVKLEDDNWWIWGGRNAIPIWYQNDYFWDAISTPAGAALGASKKYENYTLAFSLGHFATPDGKYAFNGQTTMVQILGTVKEQDYSATAALNFVAFDGHKGARRNYESDGSRDYKILMANLQYADSLWGKPLILGADGFWNIQHYSANATDKYVKLHHNHVLGGVLSLKYGDSVKSGDWMFSYYYAYIHALAINGDFAQSDWSRYDPSGVDIKGHDFRVSYTINKNFNLLTRAMLTERISSREDGNRFRLDFNFNF